MKLPRIPPVVEAAQALGDQVLDIGLKRAWTAATNTMAEVASRSAEMYVFAVHAHQDTVALARRRCRVHDRRRCDET